MQLSNKEVSSLSINGKEVQSIKRVSDDAIIYEKDKFDTITVPLTSNTIILPTDKNIGAQLNMFFIPYTDVINNPSLSELNNASTLSIDDLNEYATMYHFNGSQWTYNGSQWETTTVFEEVEYMGNIMFSCSKFDLCNIDLSVSDEYFSCDPSENVTISDTNLYLIYYNFQEEYDTVYNGVYSSVNGTDLVVNLNRHY